MRFETYINNSITPIKNQTDFTQYVRYVLSRQHYGKSRKYRKGV